MKRVSLAVLQLTMLVVGSRAFTAEPDRPYRVSFPQTWELKASNEHLQVWGLSKNSSSNVSAVVEPSGAQQPAGEPPSKTENIPLKQLEAFLKSRAEKMDRSGLREWKVDHAERKAIAKRFPAVQMNGSYLGPNGARFCFVERQINIAKSLLILTGTSKKSDSCSWAEIEKWLEHVEPLAKN